ncbi:MAG: ester cyclase [Solirubrobacterales bacterium]
MSNQEIARRIPEEGFGGGNFDLFDEHVAEDYVGHDPVDEEDSRGVEALKERASGYRTAFSDLNVAVEECFGEGDLVCTRWTASGTHDGELFGMPPTGKSMRIEGLSIDRFENGKVVETWDNWDALGMMQQLGAIPEQQPA